MEQPAEQWARTVVKRGMPDRRLPLDVQAEAYADLAAAYGILAELAHQAGDLDRYAQLSEMQEVTDRRAHELRPADPWAAW